MESITAKPNYYMTTDEFFGVLKAAISSTHAPGKRHHPEDLALATEAALEAIGHALDFVAARDFEQHQARFAGPRTMCDELT